MINIFRLRIQTTHIQDFLQTRDLRTVTEAVPRACKVKGSGSEPDLSPTQRPHVNRSTTLMTFPTKK